MSIFWGCFFGTHICKKLRVWLRYVNFLSVYRGVMWRTVAAGTGFLFKKGQDLLESANCRLFLLWMIQPKPSSTLTAISAIRAHAAMPPRARDRWERAHQKSHMSFHVPQIISKKRRIPSLDLRRSWWRRSWSTSTVCWRDLSLRVRCPLCSTMKRALRNSQGISCAQSGGFLLGMQFLRSATHWKITRMRSASERACVWRHNPVLCSTC